MKSTVPKSPKSNFLLILYFTISIVLFFFFFFLPLINISSTSMAIIQIILLYLSFRIYTHGSLLSLLKSISVSTLSNFVVPHTARLF